MIAADTRLPVAGAQVLIVGYRGVERTDATGHFRWAAVPPPAPVTLIVILPDGHVARPIRVESWTTAGDLMLDAEAVVTDTVTVDGVAPTIDSAPAASTTLLPAADIEQRAPATLTQALENVPGVAAIADGGQGAVPAIRGLGRDRSLILLDGNRVSTERRAGPNASFLDPATVSSIEVARGAGSVAYGSDAFGGVIAASTRRPDYHAPWTARVSGTVGAGIPEARGEVELSRGYGSGGILVAVHAREFDDYRAPTGTVPNSGWKDGGISALWEHSTGSGTWSAGWITGLDRDIGRPRNDATTITATTPYEDSHRLTLSYQARLAGWFRNVRFGGLYGTSRERTEQDRLATAKQPRQLAQADMSSRDGQLRITGEHGFGRIRLQMGADYQGRYGLEATDTTVAYTLAGDLASSVANPSIESAHRHGLGIFGQADAQVTPRLRLSGGLRADTVHNINEGGYFGDRRVINSAVAGLASATYTVAPRTTLTAQVARGFRDPTLTDRFYRGPVGRGFIEGNPDLEPETSRQIDVTARWENGPLRVSAACYDYRIANLVERYLVGTTNFFFRNRGAGDLRGGEVEAQASVPYGFLMDVTAQTSRGHDADTGAPLDDIAPPSVALVVRHAAGNRMSSYLRIAAIARHDAAGPSEVPTPGYVPLDAGVTWHWSRSGELSGLLRNALDQRFYSNAGPRWVDAPGRNGTLTLLLRF
ncbi:MAG TPA: TonB-dependent receptor [Vicinamibacterales bacterium]